MGTRHHPWTATGRGPGPLVGGCRPPARQASAQTPADQATPEGSRLLSRPLKSRRSRRTLPLRPRLSRRCNGNTSARPQRRRGVPGGRTNGSCSRPSSAPRSTAATTTARSRPCSEAGVRPIRLHDLRHTAASLLLAEGVHPRVVMEILGHSQISLTMNTYSHVLPSVLREAADAIERSLWGTNGERWLRPCGTRCIDHWILQRCVSAPQT